MEVVVDRFPSKAGQRDPHELFSGGIDTRLGMRMDAPVPGANVHFPTGRHLSCWAVLTIILGITAIAQAQGGPVVATIPLPTNSSGAVSVNPNTNRIYTSGGATFSPTQQITVIDGNTNSIIASMPGSGATVNPASNRIYAGQLSPSQILVYDGSTNNLITGISVAGCAYEAKVDTGNNRVEKFDSS